MRYILLPSVLIVSLISFSAFAQNATEQAKTEQAEPRILSEQFADWFYRCVEAKEAKEDNAKEDNAQLRCEVVQIAQTKNSAQAGEAGSADKNSAQAGNEDVINLLTVSLSELKQSDGKKEKTVTALTLLAPLNIYLPAGLEFSVDDGKKTTLAFRNCNNAGCWIQNLTDDKTLAALKKGQFGYARIRLINGQNINIKFSLKGLPEALKALQKGDKPKA